MNGAKRSVALKVGWILLVLVGTAFALGGAASLVNAYRAGPDLIGNVSITRLREISPELETALRGRRATAATFSVAAGVLLIWVAAVPFRRGERWAWQAVVTSVGLAMVLSMLRMPILGTRVGAGVAGIARALTMLALALSYNDMK
jgi:hypothetical protein